MQRYAFATLTIGVGLYKNVRNRHITSKIGVVALGIRDIYNDDNAYAYIQEQFSDINAIVGLSYKYSRHHETYITMLATGDATGEYHKKYRVPFGETIPGLDSIYPLLSILLGKNIPLITIYSHFTINLLDQTLQNATRT